MTSEAGENSVVKHLSNNKGKDKGENEEYLPSTEPVVQCVSKGTQKEQRKHRAQNNSPTHGKMLGKHEVCKKLLLLLRCSFWLFWRFLHQYSPDDVTDSIYRGRALKSRSFKTSA